MFQSCNFEDYTRNCCNKKYITFLKSLVKNNDIYILIPDSLSVCLSVTQNGRPLAAMWPHALNTKHRESSVKSLVK